MRSRDGPRLTGSCNTRNKTHHRSLLKRLVVGSIIFTLICKQGKSRRPQQTPSDGPLKRRDSSSIGRSLSIDRSNEDTPSAQPSPVRQQRNVQETSDMPPADAQNSGSSRSPASGGSSSNATARRPPTGTTTSSGGGGRGGRRGGSHRGQPSSSVQTPKKTSFTGRCDGLKGFIYDCDGDRTSADSFAKTTQEIAEYANKEYQHGSYLRAAIVTGKGELPDLKQPEDIKESASATTKEIWKQEISAYIKTRTLLAEHCRSLFSLVLGQCTDAIKSKLEALPEWAVMQEEMNGLGLILVVKRLMFQFETTRYQPDALCDAVMRFMSFHQSADMTNQDYLKLFQGHVQVIEHCGGSVSHHPGFTAALCEEMYDKSFEDVASTRRMAAARAASDAYLGCLFLKKADKNRYGKLLTDLQNHFARGTNSYPGDVNGAYNLIMHWKQDSGGSSQSNRSGTHRGGGGYQRHSSNNDGQGHSTGPRTPPGGGSSGGGSTEGAAFATDGNTVRGRNGQVIECFICGGNHYASACPDRPSAPSEGEQHTTDHTEANNGGVVHEETHLISSREEAIRDDNAEHGWGEDFVFTTSATTHPKSLTHGQIYKTTTSVRRKMPSTWILLDNQATCDVFCNRALLKNIRQVNSLLIISTNTGEGRTDWMGDLPGYGAVWFYEAGIANILSLHLVKQTFDISYDTRIGQDSFIVHKADGTEVRFKPSSKGLHYLDTAVTKPDAVATVLVTTVAQMKAQYHPRDVRKADMARALQKLVGRPSNTSLINAIENNLLRNCPLTRQDIMAAEKIYGKDIGCLKGKTTSSGSHPLESDESLPATIPERYHRVTIAADIMRVNGVPFLLTLATKLRFCTAQHLPDLHAGALLGGIKRVHKVYSDRGLTVTELRADGEFACIAPDLPPGVTDNICSADEHVPDIERFIRVIKERCRAIVNTSPFTRFPPRLVIEMVYLCVFWLNGVPPSPGISTTMSPRYIMTGCHLDYTKHCHLEFGTYVQTHDEHDNSMRSRTTGALALRPTGNQQGSFFFYNLNTGRVLNRKHNDWTVLPMPQQVIDRVHHIAASANAPMGLIFDEYEDDDDDPDDEPYDAADNEEADIPCDLYDEDDATAAGVDNAQNTTQNIEDDGSLNQTGNPNEERDTILRPEESTGVLPEESTGVRLEENTGVAQPSMEEQYGARQRPGLRPRRPRSYEHLHPLFHTVMTQYHVRKGLKVFGDKGRTAVLTELQQLHDRKVMSPVHAVDLSQAEKEAALQYLMFLKEKRCGKIKGRGCADGRKQRLHTTKDNSSAPTVSTEAVILTAIIEAKENRDVAVIDIPGAFMQADMDETVHIKLEGEMADLLSQIDPQMYKKYVTFERGKRVIYAVLLKALYGTLRAALLFWRLLTSRLKEWGFTINPYDWCVANKDIHGSQCTICWHVDDLKISHALETVVTNVIGHIEDVFGKEAPITISRGKVHDYLGMQLDYSKSGSVILTMIPYIEATIDEFPEPLTGSAPTPAHDSLFKIRPDDERELLGAERAEVFHHNTAKLLFLAQRARPDILLTVSFLTTRVKCADTDDWKKLVRCLVYLWGTLHLALTLAADDLHVIKWYADGSYAAHSDLKSHTGGVMTMGSGGALSISRKQKLNTKSSTEAEVVAADDVMPQLLWSRYFLEAQGYSTDNILFQDNESAMRLEKNGRASSTKRTKHMDVRFFFIADRIKDGHLRVVYCSTDEMWADYHTKPLQGHKFIYFRSLLMNSPSPEDPDSGNSDRD